LPASWQTCSPDTAKSFSAVGYFFARDLHKALGVPVGIILSAWPGTLGEEWTDVRSLAAQPILRPIVERWNAASASVKDFAAKQAAISLEFDDFELLPSAGDTQSVAISNFDDGSARTQTGGVWTYSWQDAPETTFELAAPGRGGAGYAARVAGKLDGASSSLLQANFKADGSAADLNAFAGIQFSVRGRGSFQFQTLQPTISDWDNYSVETMEATNEWKQVKIWFKDLKQAGWGVSAPFTRGALTGFVINVMAPIGGPDRPPAGLYDGMISPLLPFRIRGAIWYQGEGNTWRAYHYRTLLPALIRGWRKSWDEGELPFLIVQLPNQGTSPELGDSIWAELREAQLLTAKSVRNTGLAVTIDVGDPNNLHPPRKAEIGQRLALWALGATYGKKIVYSGPLYDAMEIKGGEAHVRFSQVGDGLDSHGEALKGFAIAGEDRKFHWASARIEGDEVIVSSPEVSAPVAVRYAWANSPECNLYNKNGLPASPFPFHNTVDLRWLEVFDSLYSGDPRPSDVPEVNFWRSMDIYSDHMVRRYEQSGLPLERIDSTAFMVGNTGTIYYRKTNAWKGMMLLTVARGGWVNTIHGNLEFLDGEKAAWFARVQKLYARLQAEGRTKTFGGVPGDVVPYGFGSLDSDGAIYTVVNPAQSVQQIELPLLSRQQNPLRCGRIIFRDAGFAPTLQGRKIKLGPGEMAAVGFGRNASAEFDLGVQNDVRTPRSIAAVEATFAKGDGNSIQATFAPPAKGDLRIIFQQRGEDGGIRRSWPGGPPNGASVGKVLKIFAEQGGKPLPAEIYSCRIRPMRAYLILRRQAKCGFGGSFLAA
jgi:hypothetical protein